MCSKHIGEKRMRVHMSDPALAVPTNQGTSKNGKEARRRCALRAVDCGDLCRCTWWFWPRGDSPRQRPGCIAADPWSADCGHGSRRTRSADPVSLRRTSRARPDSRQACRFGQHLGRRRHLHRSDRRAAWTPGYAALAVIELQQSRRQWHRRHGLVAIGAVLAAPLSSHDRAGRFCRCSLDDRLGQAVSRWSAPGRHFGWLWRRWNDLRHRDRILRAHHPDGRRSGLAHDLLQGRDQVRRHPLLRQQQQRDKLRKHGSAQLRARGSRRSLR